MAASLCSLRCARSSALLPSRHFPIVRRSFATSRPLAVVVNSDLISQITASEKTITQQEDPVKGGPTAKAQSHVGHQLTAEVIRQIQQGEAVITGKDQPTKDGPTAIAQKYYTNNQKGDASFSSGSTGASRVNSTTASEHSGVLDSDTIVKITEKEKDITGSEQPVKGGPTAKAQQHANEPITSEALHDITEGEKKITGGERIKGGPTATAQSELGKSRS